MLTLAPQALSLPGEPLSLTVIMKYEDEPLSGINIAVCRVADAAEESDWDRADGVIYKKAEAFTALELNFTDLETEKNIALAKILYAYAVQKGIPMDKKVIDGELRPFECMRLLGMKKPTFYHYVKRYKAQNNT